MIKNLKICLLSIFALFIVVSCSDNNETEQLSSDSEIATNKVDTVIINEMKFIPDNIIVNKGDTVLFINQDIVPHDATEENQAWKSPTLANGDEWRYVPTESVNYYCSIHLVMKGKITVN